MSSIPRGPVTATLNFFAGTTDGEAPYTWIEQPADPNVPVKNYEQAPQQTTINDARGQEDSFTLDKDAFKFISGVPPSKEESWTDDESIKKNYYPEVEQLLLDNVPGANKIYLFDHTIRRQQEGAKRGPVSSVHVDQTHAAVLKRINKYYNPEEAALLEKGRYRIINVWRTLNKQPLESFPLAYASAASARDEDFVPVELRYPEGYRGETAGVSFSEGQKWWYLSGMTGDERVLLECFDSESLKEGSEIKGRVPHTAFEDPRTSKGAEGRESIEVRALVFGP